MDNKRFLYITMHCTSYVATVPLFSTDFQRL